MFLMIWVNDFWTLKDIPKWLKHAGPKEDYLGFSDIIFPWFLFVMGMSIPFSIENRIIAGQTKYKICKHIFFRAIALIIIGLFHMNMEMYNQNLSILSKPIFVLIATTAFFMIWNNADRISQIKLFKKSVSVFGVIILVLLYFNFVGKDYDGNVIRFSIHWWGILGLIGWVYAFAAPAYLVMRKSIKLGYSILFIFFILNIISSAAIPYNIFSWQNPNWIPGGGGLHILTFAGILNSLFLMRFLENRDQKQFYITLFLMAIGSLVLGFLFREFFIINKIKGTITWILFSLSTAFVFFLFVHWVADNKKIISWYHPISTAGTATLTCYLIPYYFYNINSILQVSIPVVFLTGILGLFKSLIYSYIIVLICKGLKTINVELKI